ncbi:hypothetical protein M9H77_06443 [Catharanthus roseus]|uniref:Uncharacterized protein n=1 Tax=Catharanthus roseus TaxID=4058 RepID=A0ACC0BSJ2_CATRO|nr:hypothetical protein M9H77_06443 [Catharanthus roseus]
MGESSRGSKEGRSGRRGAGSPMSNDLQLMAIVASGVSHGHLYGASSKAARFIAESSQAAAGLAPCCLDHEQRLMLKVDDAVLRVSAAFDEHMRNYSSIISWCTFHSHR